MTKEPQNISRMRNAIKLFMRSLGVLEGKKTFCYNCTYAQCHVIWETAQESKISVNELATRLNISKSAVSRTVDDLVNKGYLERKPNPKDRRYVDIELTEKGQKTFQEIQLSSRQYFETILENIPENKRETTLDGIQTFSTALYQVFKKDTTE
ncbi:MarR family winged helix-turn-helix transcriptional regulator [Sporomusa sphaeroides]|uniref:MarR family winged helix-turn-helix transcriptional regulator n=1 Tax=Sporomusa sphaeroides TaxID=47679 RepID=UPI002B914F43|nr:MarR family winged helix-turn-helix transcriptional regulator [Sporomusa sphaeroides]HML32019.1 MarR family winged helix-turn-helix transcriptional regulator [Sporomusa sphaeroides]